MERREGEKGIRERGKQRSEDGEKANRDRRGEESGITAGVTSSGLTARPGESHRGTRRADDSGKSAFRSR